MGRGRAARTIELVETAVTMDWVSVAAEIAAAHVAVTAAAQSALEHARHAGELLTRAKQQVSHGEWLPWLVANCPTVSPRTAQAYMRVSREWTTIEAAKAQRVAPLALRDALVVVSTRTVQVSAMGETDRDEVLSIAGSGTPLWNAVGDVKRARMRDAIVKHSPDMYPSVHEDRVRRVLRLVPGQYTTPDPDLGVWQIKIGPNAAGLELPALVADRRERPYFAGRRAEADDMLAESKRLRSAADELERHWRKFVADTDREIGEELAAEHGPIHYYTQTFCFFLKAPEIDAELQAADSDSAREALLEQALAEGRATINRGTEGDIRLWAVCEGAGWDGP